MTTDEDKKKALQELSDFGQEMEKARILEDHRIDAWWDGLSEQEREDAFYSVCKRIYQAEIKDRGTYRYALYDVFKFGANMYLTGMDCGFMALHNALGDGETYQAMRGVNRFEVIDDTGRAYTKYLKDDESIRYSLQDDERTLKVFIDKVKRLKLEDL